MLLLETLAAAAGERGVDKRPAMQRTLANLEERVLAAALKSHRGERITISAQEVEAFLRRFPDTLEKPRRVRLRSITKRFEPDAAAGEKEVLRRRMQEIHAELEAGADFATVAERESETQSRFHGGLIGVVAPGEMRPEIDAVAMALEQGELSAAIETGDVLTILRCESVLEAVEPSPEEQQQAAVRHLRRRQVKRDWADFQAELLRQARPRFDLAAARKASADPSEIVARFDLATARGSSASPEAGATLTRGDLLDTLSSGPMARSLDATGDDALEKILERLVVQVRCARRARDLGLDQDPELIERLEWQRLRLLAGDELRLRIQEVLEPPGKQEIRAYFEAHPKRFSRPPEFELALIRIDLEAGQERQIYRRAVELRQQLAAGEIDFAAAARAQSAHPSAARGGALGWLSGRQVGGFGGLVHRSVNALAPGQTSELLQREDSLYILRLNDRREAQLLSFEEASAAAERRLGQERVKEIQAGIEQKAKAALEVRLVPEPGA